MEGTGGHEAGWRAAYEEGRRLFGPLPLREDLFARAFEERGRRRGARAPTGEAPAATTPPGSRGGDLFLAVACEEQVAGAWEAFCREFPPRLRSFLIRRGATAEEASAVVDDLPGNLCAPPPRGVVRTRLGTYDGGSRLFTWLAAIVHRRLWDLRRARPGAGAGAEAATTPTARAPPPLRTLVDEESARLFEDALHEAWGDLTPKECLVLLLRYRDGLRQTEIARILGVGEPRVTHLVQQGLDKLRGAVRKRLRDTPPGPHGDGASLWHALREIAARRLESSAGGSDSPDR